MKLLTIYMTSIIMNDVQFDYNAILIMKRGIVLKVNKNNLLLIAGLVWGFAGFNILRIGIVEYRNNLNLLNILISLAIFILFQSLIFGKMVKKHTVRIKEYEEDKQYFYKFFDKKSYFIMVFMIALGIGLRASGIVPEVFIAVFYTGLGVSLLTAGILFIINFFK